MIDIKVKDGLKPRYTRFQKLKTSNYYSGNTKGNETAYLRDISLTLAMILDEIRGNKNDD